MEPVKHSPAAAYPWPLQLATYASTSTGDVMEPVKHCPAAAYLWKPQCPCGHPFRGYLTRTAALIARDAHRCKEDK